MSRKHGYLAGLILLLLIGALLIASSLFAQSPSVTGGANPNGECSWHIYLEGYGFPPNTEVTLDSSFSARDCAGNDVSRSWSSGWGTTDSNGYIRADIQHGDYGTYTYTFSAGGYSAQTTIQYEYQPPSVEPTPLPTDVPVPTVPPEQIQPTSIPLPTDIPTAVAPSLPTVVPTDTWVEPTQAPPQNGTPTASAYISIANDAGCEWKLPITGTGFTPNTAVSVTVTRNATGCDGSFVGGTDTYYLGTTDANGTVTQEWTHWEYGHYTYTLTDDTGKQAGFIIEYTRNVPSQTAVPTSVPPVLPTNGAPTNQPALPTALPTSAPELPTALPTSVPEQPIATAVSGPTATSWVTYQGNCSWTAYVSASGLAPNTPIYMSVERNAIDCATDESRTGGWSDWQIASTDSTGFVQVAIGHGDYGSFNFTVRAGDQILTTLLQYPGPNGEQPLPQATSQPTAIPAATNVPQPETPSTECETGAFTASASRVREGETITLRLEGAKCKNGVRAIKFGIGSKSIAEIGSTSLVATWSSQGFAPGNVTIWAKVTNGGWQTAAMTSLTIEVISNGNTGGGEVEAPETDNCQLIGCSGNNGGNNNQPSNPPAQSCNSAKGIGIGTILVFTSPAGLRSASNSESGELTSVPQGSQTTAIGGPQCGSNQVWWETQYNSQTGWVSENNVIANGSPLPGNNSGSGSNSGGNNNGGGSGNNTPTQPNPNNPPTQTCAHQAAGLTVGGTGRIIASPTVLTLYGSPNTNRSSTSITWGATFTIEEGPTCAGGNWWWRVNANGSSGWVQDGNSVSVWVETSVIGECSPGWIAPDIYETGEVWIYRSDYAIKLQDFRISERGYLTTLVSSVWWHSSLNEVGSALHEQNLREYLASVASSANIANLFEGLDYFEVARLYFSGGVETARVSYTHYRQIREVLESYNTPQNICGNYVKIPINVWDTGTVGNTFPRWWWIWAEYLPVGAKSSTCSRYPDTCSILGF